MQADAYARARKVLAERPGVTALAGVLGVLQSLLVLATLIVAGLIVAVIDTRGETRYPASRTAELPSWAVGMESGVNGNDTIYADTGLLAVAASGLRSDNPVHRAFGSLLVGAVNRVLTLRTVGGTLASLLALALVFVLLFTWLDQARRARIAVAAAGAATNLRRLIHRQMYRLGQSSLPTEGTGPVVNLLTREVNDIREALFTDLDEGVRLPVLGAGLLLLALSISWILAVFLGSLGVLFWLFARRLGRESRLAVDRALRDSAVHLSLLHEDLGMLRTVRVYGMESVDNRRFDEHVGGHDQADARHLLARSDQVPRFFLLAGAACALAVGLLGYAAAVTRRIEPSSALFLIAALAGLAGPAFAYIRLQRAVRVANRSAAAVFEFLDQKPDLHQQGGAKFLPPLKHRITFENVTLENRSGRVLLDRVSTEIPAGGRTAIMSLDEDSKLALVALIPRLIDPKSGRVRVDGQDLRDVTLESIRAQVATVLQADLTFTDSVLMNIGLGDPSFPLPRVIEAAKVAHAHNFVQDLPHGYDTVIGPVGHYLRPDEQYRIALARAYLHDPSIVIIEEPSTHLDDNTKQLVDDTIARLARDRTLIILPHRLSTIRSCQQIIVLHNGRLEVVGRPEELQNESKLFRHLQYVEFNQFATGEIEAGQMST